MSSPPRKNARFPIEPALGVEKLIYLIRGQRVILDQDIAALYGVETRVLVQAIKRNIERFPPDFMFQLTTNEFSSLRSQIVISKGRGGRRFLPYAFTEQGVAMLSAVLSSRTAVHVSIEIMRAFVRLRQLLGSEERLLAKITRLERKYNRQFHKVFAAIYQLMEKPQEPAKLPIGFQTELAGS